MGITAGNTDTAGVHPQAVGQHSARVRAAGAEHILLAKAKRALRQTQQELASTQERLWQLEAAQSAKNSNQVNRI